jgi:hypothetical protein
MTQETRQQNESEAQGREASELHGLLSAAKTGAKWMRWWLEQNECECEYGHTCGKTERMRELEEMEAAIAKAEGS